jgi:hypothetical protein
MRCDSRMSDLLQRRATMASFGILKKMNVVDFALARVVETLAETAEARELFAEDLG